jgi:cell division protein FtsQ
MDGGGRLDQPLTGSGLSGAAQAGMPNGEPSRSRVTADSRGGDAGGVARSAAYRRSATRWLKRFVRLPPPRGTGIAATLLLITASLVYGLVKGDHVPAVIDWLKGARDTVANSVGFRIAAISLTGPKEVSREEVLTIAGVTGRASLLFLDADSARARLMANPWIGDAAILKLYPDRLQITITERQAFALWQKDGRVSVIAADGTVLEPFVEDRYVGLPLVVGKGAEKQAKSFLTILDNYPEIRSLLRASVLVADRRWNLRLTNGIDVRLPETNVDQALERLVVLDRDKKLLSRDINTVDLRLPDRVTVQLSDAAAQAREDALKDAKKKKKGGDA